MVPKSSATRVVRARSLSRKTILRSVGKFIRPKRYYYVAFIDQYRPRIIANSFRTYQEALELLVLGELDRADKYTIIKGSEAIKFDIPIVSPVESNMLLRRGIRPKITRRKNKAPSVHYTDPVYRKEYQENRRAKRRRYIEFCKKHKIHYQ